VFCDYFGNCVSYGVLHRDRDETPIEYVPYRRFEEHVQKEERSARIVYWLLALNLLLSVSALFVNACK